MALPDLDLAPVTPIKSYVIGGTWIHRENEGAGDGANGL